MMNEIAKRILISLTLGPIVLFLIYKGGVFFYFLLFFCLVAGLYEIIKLKILRIKLLIFTFLITFILSCYQLRMDDLGLMYLFLAIIITWLSDVGGFVLGKFIGGKKINIISPNKTYIGFFGSVLFGQLSLIFLYYYNFEISSHLMLVVIIIFAASLFVIAGDLCFSYFKRKENIKDYSNLLPGHGGIFDRIDGLIFVVIYFNFIATYI